MDLFEYQAKELFAEYGVPVQAGKVARTAEEARVAAIFTPGAATTEIVDWVRSELATAPNVG